MPGESAARVVVCCILVFGVGGADAAPEIANVVAPSSAGLYTTLEAAFDVTTVAERPCWPYDESPNPGVAARVGVSVDGLFSSDNWRTTVIQPAFYYQDYQTGTDASGKTRTLSGGMLWLYPTGHPVWRIRFAPTRLGEWKYKIRATDASGTVTGPEMSFTCLTSGKHGFVRASPTDPRYFELSDGTYIPLIGISYDCGSMTDIPGGFARLKALGVNFIRSWWQSSNPALALFGAGGQGGDQNWHIPEYTTEYLPPGHVVVPKLTGGTSKVSIWATIPVRPNTRYSARAVVKTLGLTGTGDYGVCLAADPVGEGRKLASDSDWAPVTWDFTTPNIHQLTWFSLVLKNAAGGAVYVSSMSVKEDLGGGALGPEILLRNDFQAHTNYPQPIAWSIDRQLESAADNDVYVRAVIEEKSDSFFSRIRADGTYGSRDDNNVYAGPNHACRTLQSYYWRYLIARYGPSTALHSIEFVNEGDPFNGNHYEAVAALGDYVRLHDPNKHVVSTSNWHSFPPGMWRSGRIDCADLHMYMGWGVASGGNRLYPGWDGSWVAANVTHYGDLGSRYSFDTDVHHSGARSLRMVIPGTGVCDRQTANLSFQCGIALNHKIRIRFWAKGQGIEPYAELHGHGLYCSVCKDGGDWVAFAPGTASGQMSAPSGTYDWTPVEISFVNANPDARILAVVPRGDAHQAADGTLWIDDVVVEDLTTGQTLNYNGDFEEIEPESYDVVAGHCSFSRLTRSFGYSKPTVRGEVGLCHPQRFTNPYKGFPFTGEDQLLIDDASGVWWRKWVWAHVDADGLYEIYWWPTLLLDRGYPHAKAFQDFMRDVPLSNGHYADAAATVSNAALRVLGQKNTVNGRAHLWIDNRRSTWKNVVDNVTIGPESAQVSLDGLADGTYQAEWWDTTTGGITRTEDVQCSQGRITLSVSGLTSDIACKIGPPPPSISLRVTVIDGKVISGSEVTIAVDYTNTGPSEAHNATLTARIPAEMDYVAGSAEATGGTYDSVAKALNWLVESVAPGGGGRKSYKATVR